MRNIQLPFQILTEYLRIGDNKYQIGKKLKIPTSQVIYHLNKIKNIIDVDNLPDFKKIAETLIPPFQSVFGGLDYNQAEFLISYLFYYVMHEYYE